MALKETAATKNAALNATGIKPQMALGYLYLFSGTVPATADEALDFVGTHTEIVHITNNSTATGITFDAPVSGVLSKAAAETWSGVVAITGFNAASPQAPTFYRLCAAGDNGRLIANATTGYRIQGSVGGPSSGADLQLGTASLTNGNTQAVGAFSYSLA